MCFALRVFLVMSSDSCGFIGVYLVLDFNHLLESDHDMNTTKLKVCM